MQVNYDPVKDILHILISDCPIEKTAENQLGTLFTTTKMVILWV